MIEIPEAIKTYIDSLDDEGRDRIIAGELGGCKLEGQLGCLMQLGEGQSLYYSRMAELAGRNGSVWVDYDGFTTMGSNAEAVAAIKAYAGRHNRIDTTNSEAPAPTNALLTELP